VEIPGPTRELDSVDDFQWLDAESAQILLFVARRLCGERLVIILAVRAEPGTAQPDTGLASGVINGRGCEDRERNGLNGHAASIGVIGRVDGGNPSRSLSASVWPARVSGMTVGRRARSRGVSTNLSSGAGGDCLISFPTTRALPCSLRLPHDTGGRHTADLRPLTIFP
jgi:hypothetical protein